MINFYNEIDKYSRVQKISESTVYRYSKELRLFCEYLAEKLHCQPQDVCLDRIYTIRDLNNLIIAYKPLDTQLIDSYLLELSQIDSYSKLANATHALRSFFKYIRKNENFPDLISHTKFFLSHYKPEETSVQVLSRHEFLKYLHSMVTHSDNLVRDSLLFGILFTTGCRINELLTLKISSINFDDEMLVLLKTKTKVQRTVVLRKGFGKIIKAYISSRGIGENDYLFINEDNGDPLKRDYVDRLFKFFLEKANLSPLRIHSIRHSYATFMRDVGIDMFTLMELMGHESFQSTLHYTQHYLKNPTIKIKENNEVYAYLRSIKKSDTSE